MKKRFVTICSLILLLWFFLDMIGVYFGEKYLVTRSYIDDGLFFVIYLVALLLFVYKEKIGKYILNVWLFMWFIAQFFSHWWCTIMGNGFGMINYFKNSIKLFESTTKYIPDIYHIILHILILITLISLNMYLFKNRKQKN